MKLNEKLKQKYPESLRRQLKEIFREPKKVQFLKNNYGAEGIEELKSLLKEQLVAEIRQKQERTDSLTSKVSAFLNDDTMKVVSEISKGKEEIESLKSDALAAYNIKIEDSELSGPKNPFADRVVSAIAKAQDVDKSVIEAKLNNPKTEIEKTKQTHKVGFKM